MDNERFEKHIKPILTYIGLIGAVLTSIAYIILIFILIKGFKYEQTTQTVVFALVNAAVGLIIANFLKYQGISFAKEIPANQELLKNYYGAKTKDKKNHSLSFFWITSIIKDIITKGLSIAATTCGLIYIVIVGSNDWSLLLMSIVNLLLFICFGLLSLNKAYDYFNNTYVAYMKERIDETSKKKTTTSSDIL